MIARLTCTTALCLAAAAAGAEPVTTIRNNGSPANRVDLVVLGDGYTAAQIASGQYSADVEAAVAGFFAQEPFSDYRSYFNVHRIEVTSAESGADKPARTPAIFRNTALDAAYDCGGNSRLICVSVAKVNTVLANSIPQPNARDVILVLVNDPEYGGSGGSIGVASIHTAATELVLHELGHSFGLLTDEYGGPPPPACNSVTEPAAANATRQTVRSLIKWSLWIDAATPLPTSATNPAVPGLYEGAQYCDTGLYRPTFNSKMRSLGVPFEQINTEQLLKRIYNFVSPVDDVSPATTAAITIPFGSSRHFSVVTPRPQSHSMTFDWRLDGISIGSSASQLVTGAGAAGIHTLEVRVSDPTALVRSDTAGVVRATRTWSVAVTGGITHRGDFDADGKRDLAVYRPSTGYWYVRPSRTGASGPTDLAYQWGLTGDVPVSGDFDGDGATDLTVFRPSTGNWYIRYSSAGYSTADYGAYQWGIAGDRPLAADFDGDGKTDVSVYRPPTGEWFIRYSSLGYSASSYGYHQWGLPGDLPIVGDFDADGRTELTVYRPSTGEWFIRSTATGSSGVAYQWGLTGDLPLVTDFDGDGKTDIAIYRPSTGGWYIRYSSTGYAAAGYGFYQWGLSGDTPLSGDFDGDGKTDLAVYRPSTHGWYIRYSSTGYSATSYGAYQWGATSDEPVP